MTDEQPVEVVVVTGMSGAGRTNAAKVLEDLGYFVLDNLPAPIIRPVTELAAQPGSSLDQIALVADVRGRQFFSQLMNSIQDLREDPSVRVRVLFLEADGEALRVRFSATRRKHPLGGEDGVTVGIERERELLHDLRGWADLVIDTSDLNVHELRDRIIASFGSAESAAMRVNVMSFGFKYGPPKGAEIVMDVRFLPNPHWVPELRGHTGLEEPVQEYVRSQPATEDFVARFKALLETTLPGYQDEGKRYLTIAIGCTGGKHRSVFLSELMGEWLREEMGVPVNVSHRDLGRE